MFGGGGGTRLRRRGALRLYLARAEPLEPLPEAEEEGFVSPGSGHAQVAVGGGRVGHALRQSSLAAAPRGCGAGLRRRVCAGETFIHPAGPRSRRSRPGAAPGSARPAAELQPPGP
ncbi:unnamed protein product [Lepidochelys kempii]